MRSVVLNSNVELGERIQAWRKLRGYKQREVAKVCKVTVPAVSMWEAGTEIPTHRHLQTIVGFFELTMLEFYGAIPKGKKAAKAGRAA